MRLARRAGLVLALAALASPVAAQEAAGEGRVPVAARDLPRGAVLEAEDVAMAVAEEAGRGAVVEDPVGWVTRRVIAAGEPLREPAVARPDLVRSGEVVQVVWRDGPVEIRLIGRAMSSGGRGDRVNVRVDAKRRFAGVVEGQGVVRMESGDNGR